MGTYCSTCNTCQADGDDKEVKLHGNAGNDLNLNLYGAKE